MARIEVDTLVVVRRVVVEFEDRSVPMPRRDATVRSGGVVPGWLGALPSWSVNEKPRHSLRGVAAGALLTLAAVALGDITRRRASLPALPAPPSIKALPSATRRSLPALPDALSQPEP